MDKVADKHAYNDHTTKPPFPDDTELAMFGKTDIMKCIKTNYKYLLVWTSTCRHFLHLINTGYGLNVEGTACGDICYINTPS